ncbi:MAG TPA: hypothetical protein VFJ16_03530 [Longimicrobium sp.]|nr:hypothetical protein [Longimicrobium sp.]
MSEQPAVAVGKVVVTGLEIPFGDLVILIIKVTLASIPAYLILLTLSAILVVLFGGFLAALARVGASIH